MQFLWIALVLLVANGALDVPTVDVTNDMTSRSSNSNGGLSVEDACLSLQHSLVHVSFMKSSLNLRRRTSEERFLYSLYEGEERVSLAERRPFNVLSSAGEEQSAPTVPKLSLCLSRENSFSLTLHSETAGAVGVVGAAGAEAQSFASASDSDSASASASASENEAQSSVRGAVLCGQYFAPLNEAFEITHSVLSTCYKFNTHFSQEGGPLFPRRVLADGVPTSVPTSIPSALPSGFPTPPPTSIPTSIPSSYPTAPPSEVPTSTPTFACLPTTPPSAPPSSVPSAQPSVPTSQPTSQPSRPTNAPTAMPSAPTPTPTLVPTAIPTDTPAPSMRPSPRPTNQNPTFMPTTLPTAMPTLNTTTSAQAFIETVGGITTVAAAGATTVGGASWYLIRASQNIIKAPQAPLDMAMQI